MPTALAVQLTQIRARSSNPLNLKAQKKAHSKSLLFEPLVAATQDFDSLYQICYEGYEDLCRLDPRFMGFANSVFSEQSKLEDRTQMTAMQNQQLDDVLEEFLRLVGARILLKPAIKAIEWLVRRFRVHEYNVLCFIMTFLPFHNTPLFSTVLSILPEDLPPTLRFLNPYIQSLSHPPRHAVVHSASNNRNFLASFSAHVLKSSRFEHPNSTLISFWASIVTEGVALMLDHAHSARRETQRQHQEDIILFMLPILNNGLSVENVPDLRVACYMIMIVLASKVDLGEGVVIAMMEAVASDWSQTSHAGLICLAVLAEQMQTPSLPKKVFKAAIALQSLDGDLLTIRKQYNVDKLSLGLSLGIISRLEKARDESKLRLLRNLLEARLMDDVSSIVVIKSMISAAQMTASDMNSRFDVQGSLTDLLLRLYDSKNIGKLVQDTLRGSALDLSRSNMSLQRVLSTQDRTPEQGICDLDMKDTDGQPMTEEFDSLTSRIPTKTAYEISFLSSSESYVFESLLLAFLTASPSAVNRQKFSELPVLRKSLAMTEPLFLSFFIRVWCGPCSPDGRAEAIRTIVDYFGKEALTTDVQLLIPYILYALADPSLKVRRAAGDLVLVLASAYSHADAEKKHDEGRSILGREQIYGQGDETKKVAWLSIKDTARFLTDILVPGLEECLFDEGHVSRLLLEKLNSPRHNKGPNTMHNGLKTSQRLAIFHCLCSHVLYTPLYTVKFRLLQTLNQVSKVGSMSRTKLLLPLLVNAIKQDEHYYDRICSREQLEASQLLNCITSVVSPGDREGIQTLKTIIESPNKEAYPSLKSASLHRIQTIWPMMKTELHSSLAKVLLELALSNAGEELDGGKENEVIETLRVLPLSTAVLKSFAEDLPIISSRLQDKPPPSKRRRTGEGQSSESFALDARYLDFAIRKITLVLELVEDSHAGRHPELLRGLFQVVSDLQHSQGYRVTAIDYLMVLAMESMIAIIKGARTPSAFPIDQANIRSDVLIDCIRTTSNPQVRNTALLLVSALAEVTPHLILHSIMPMFTFMGANVMRQEDDYSSYVVNRTMESVIPCLLQSLHKRNDSLYGDLSELLLSFAAAFVHIPSRRRLDLFVSLVNKLGPYDNLFALLTVLMDKYPNESLVIKFAADLAGHYDVKTRLRTIEKYLEVILDAWEPKPALSKNLLLFDDNHSVEGTTANLLPLASAVLADATLISDASRQFSEEGEGAACLRATYAHILEEIFALSHQCKQTRAHVLCMQVLDASLGLISMPEMIGSLEHLLKQTENNIRLQALQSLQRRLTDRKLNLKASQTACLKFLSPLSSIIQESQDATVKYTAVVCVDHIVELFGKKDIATVIRSAQVISGNDCLGATETSLQTIALLCLATIAGVSGDTFIAIFPQAFPKAMNVLATSMNKESKHDHLHNAVYSFLSTLLLHAPWTVRGADLDKFLDVSYKSANAGMGDQCDSSRREALNHVPQRIEAKECFAALDRTWTNAVTEGPRAVKDHLEIFRLTIDRQPKSAIIKHSETLASLFLKAFDLRRIQSSPHTDGSYDIKEIEEIEEAIHASAIAMIYKLNDATFRPIFSRMLEWGSQPISNKTMKTTAHRQITWYTFLSKFFDTFKSIVTSYAGLILEDSVEVLNNVLVNDEDSTNLWRRVILALQKTFEHDQDDFYQSPSHLSQISNALIGQISHAHQIAVLPELIPAIVELAVATDASNHHKEMNAAIIKFMRSESAPVRLAAVQCERALTKRLGEEWLALLPEMLPFISEALEDDDEAVEKEVQKWVEAIEGVLGESLNPMLR